MITFVCILIAYFDLEMKTEPLQFPKIWSHADVLVEKNYLRIKHVKEIKFYSYVSRILVLISTDDHRVGSQGWEAQ